MVLRFCRFFTCSFLFVAAEAQQTRGLQPIYPDIFRAIPDIFRVNPDIFRVLSTGHNAARMDRFMSSLTLSIHDRITRSLSGMPTKQATSKRAANYNNDVPRLPGERWVTMTNALTRAGHGLSLSEKRIVCCAVATLDSRKAADLNRPPVTRIYATDYAETFGIDMNTAYEQLQGGGR